ncbi:MAG: prepilin peptidase [Chloroflexi bacterium]|nr:prepilin peptidase [Chloroflexota bacterium]
MILVGALAALGAGWLCGMGLNCLAAWLVARRAGSPAEATAVPEPKRWRRLGLQIACALAMAGLWVRHGPTPVLASAVLAALLLLLIAAIDLDVRLVLNEVLLVGAGLALLHAAAAGWSRLALALIGGGLALGLFLLLALLQRGAMGAGDVKLAGLLGLMFGYPAALQALLLGVIVGGVVAAALLLTRRLGRKALIPYAPFLSAGGILTLLLN